MTSNTTLTMPLRSILEKDKLNRTNSIDWYRILRIVLRQERKEYILDQPILEEPTTNDPRAQKDTYNKNANDSVDVTCLMLGCMESEI